MTKKKKNPQKAGARGKYNDDFPLLAEGLARRRLSDSQIATALDISVGTYYEYQKRYPEFLQALKIETALQTGEHSPAGTYEPKNFLVHFIEQVADAAR